MSDTFSRVAIITGVARRRRFTTEQKLAVVGETMPARHVHQLVSRSACASSSAVLGRKTLEVEILKESRKALDLARAKKASRCRALHLGTVPDEDRDRHARPGPVQHRRSVKGARRNVAHRTAREDLEIVALPNWLTQITRLARKFRLVQNEAAESEGAADVLATRIRPPLTQLQVA